MGRKYTTSLYLDEELVYKMSLIAEDLNYNSLSAFVRDVLYEIVETYEIIVAERRAKNKRKSLRRKLFNAVVAKTLRKLI